MRAHRLALAELRRLTSGRLLRLALVALLVVPTLYAGLYLYANEDPYAHLDRVPAAIVSEDAGATLSTGEKLLLGDQVARSLVDSHSFEWHRVTRDEARAGVEDDTYAFALVVPRSFSADIASSAGAHPRQAHLEQITNDANGYLAHTISNQVVAQVTRSVASQVSSAAASRSLEGFATIHSKVTDAVKGAADLERGLGRLDAGAKQLARGTDDLATAQPRLADGAARLASGARTAAGGASSLATGADRLSGGLATLDSQTAGLPGATQALADGAHSLADGTSRIGAGATSLADGADTAASGAAALTAGAKQLTAGATKVAAGAHQVAAGNARIDEAGRAAGQAVRDLRAARTQNEQAVVQQLDALEQANAALAQPNPRISQAVARLRTQLGTLSSRLDGIDGQVAATSASLTRLAAGSQQVATGADQVAAGSATLADRLGDLATGVGRLDAGATKLAAAAGQASSGAGRLAAGADTLASGAGRLHDGIAAAHSGATQLSDGATALAGGTTRLASGADALADGERQAVDGTARLRTGAADLARGTTSAAHGATRLHDGLAAGLDAIPDPSKAQREAAAQVVGNPVAVEQSSQASAGSYGAGMAPFFTGLALWIGAYVLFLVVRPLSNRALAAEQPGWRVALSGWMTPALLGVGQALLLLVVAIKGLGFHVEHLPAMLVFMAFVSTVYAAILHLLAARFGAVGKFLGLVLLVVQLVSAGGTFPWQTLPGPLRALHRVLPMSYAIDGIRHLMYGGGTAIVWLDVLVLALFLAAAVALSSLAAERMRGWTPARVKPDLVL